MEDLSAITTALSNRQPTDPMPVLFVGHGSPMNAIQDTPFSVTWNALGTHLPRPTAILCISAHWLTDGDTRVSVADSPETIHDFSGFPYQLFEQRYPAPGAPELARQVMGLITTRQILADDAWGLDHGAWSVLIRMFPAADIPVFQLSLDYRMPPQDHFQMARALSSLRDAGVLIVGSGNLVHNLWVMRSDAPPYDWAEEFDRKITAFIDRGEDDAVADFRSLGDLAKQAHPTWDHFLPVLYVLAQRRPSDTVQYFSTGFDLASISMRSMLLV
ncbi:LigB: extradiol ring-cleavage dioxygenase class III protein subunit B [Desulfosarcina variabilis str. Montpellier]|uniref:4,5-DOPA-extradiol-dioxygenase n=1 Tax=Desulfosarcina variabilis TaxID=2300 RepID=UPI003AFB4F95